MSPDITIHTVVCLVPRCENCERMQEHTRKFAALCDRAYAEIRQVKADNLAKDRTIADLMKALDFGEHVA